MAWDKTTTGKEDGGLGFEKFQQQSSQLKMRWCGKIMEEEDLLWVKLTQENIKIGLSSGPGCRTRRDWTLAEGLLLENNSGGSSSLLRDLAKGLYKGRNSLCFDSVGASLPGHLTVEKLLILFYNEEEISTQ